MFSKSSKWAYYSREYTTQGSILLFSWTSNHLKFLGKCFICKSVKSIMSMKSIRIMNILEESLSIEDLDHFNIPNWIMFTKKEMDEHTIRGGILLISYPSNWVHYSREYINKEGYYLGKRCTPRMRTFVKGGLSCIMQRMIIKKAWN